MPFQPVDYDPFAQGDPETTGAVQASQAMEPAVTDYLSHTGDQFASSYDPSRSFAANALDPQGLQNAMGIALAFGPGAIKGFHGSPFDFPAESGAPLGQFRDSQIGTGEGNQSYSYGHYIAEARGTGQQYQKKLSAAYTKTNDGLIPQGDAWQSLYDVAKNTPLQTQRGKEFNLPPDAARSIATNIMDGIIGSGDITKFLTDFELPAGQYGAAYQAAAQHATDRGFAVNKGHLYEVNINAEPDTFLDWDKPLNDQSEATREFFNGVPGITGDSTGAEAYRLVGRGNEAGLSQAMRDAGISGVKYLDAGSRAAGDGTSNFVVFDPKMIEIVKKYGLAPLVAGGAMTLSGNADAATHAIPTNNNPFTIPVDYDPFAAGGF